MLVRSPSGVAPRLGARVFVAPTAVLVGDVDVGDDASIWYGVVVRGDIHWIRIGARSNLQDGVVVHVERDRCPTLLEEDVSVGHGAILHGCTVRRGSLVGAGAVVLNDAEIGAGSLVAAGAVLREGMRVPERSLVAGVPAVVKRELTADESERVRRTAANYLEYKERELASPLDDRKEGLR